MLSPQLCLAGTWPSPASFSNVSDASPAGNTHTNTALVMKWLRYMWNGSVIVTETENSWQTAVMVRLWASVPNTIMCLLKGTDVLWLWNWVQAWIKLTAPFCWVYNCQLAACRSWSAPDPMLQQVWALLLLPRKDIYVQQVCKPNRKASNFRHNIFL